MMEQIQGALQAMTWMEMVAVFFGLVYIYLAANEIIWCWLAAIVSVVLYIYLCIEAKLYAETFLQFYYLAMAIYGWINWSKSAKNNEHITIKTWRPFTHVLVIGGGLAAVLFSGFSLGNYSDAAMPYYDSFTTTFSIITTFMVTRKVLENWIYWFIIDGASIYLYYSRELYLTSLLFVAYTIIVIFGYLKWQRIYLQQQEEQAS